MVPRIDPALPIVWRSPHELQFGALAPRVVLRDPGELETGLVAALRHGARLSTLQTIGAGLDGSPADIARLLEVLAPTFEPEPAADGAASIDASPPAVIALDADGIVAERLTSGLTALGHNVVPVDEVDPERADLAVIAAAWVIPPPRYLPWLRSDVPHLAVVFDESGTRVGPLVEPGTGPCLRCLDLARRDADVAWPVIAAQLAGRAAAGLTARVAHDAAALAASVLDDRISRGVPDLAAASITLPRFGDEPRRRLHPPHPGCGCRAPGGSATAPVPLDAFRSGAASSARAGAVPA